MICSCCRLDVKKVAIYRVSRNGVLCRLCRNELRKKYRDSERSAHLKWAVAHPDKIKEYDKRYYKKHSDLRKKKANAFYYAHANEEQFKKKRQRSTAKWALTVEGQCSIKRSQQKYIKNNQEKKAAQRAARIVKSKGKCIFCGSTKNIHKHHPDYRKPLGIIELCQRCHIREHQFEKKYHIMQDLRELPLAA